MPCSIPPCLTPIINREDYQFGHTTLAELLWSESNSQSNATFKLDTRQNQFLTYLSAGIVWAALNIFPASSRVRYAASIERIDYDDEKVLIHYRQWSHRYDEWFDWASPYLRPVERIQLRREGLQQDEGPPTPVRAKPSPLPSSHAVGFLEAGLAPFSFCFSPPPYTSIHG